MKSIFIIICLVSSLSLSAQRINDIACQDAIKINSGITTRDTLSLGPLGQSYCSYGSIISRWLKYEGENKVVDIRAKPIGNSGVRFEYFYGNCDSLICINYLTTNFYLEKGKTIYLRPYIYFDNYLKSRYEITIDTFTIEKGDFCDDAIKLICDEETNINFSNMTTEKGDSCQFYGGNFAWLDLIGDGKIKKLQWNNTLGITPISFLFLPNGCKSNYCQYINYSYENFEFITEIDKEYKIGLFANNSQFEKIKTNVKLICNDTASIRGKNCANAIKLSCGEITSITLSQKDPYNIINNSAFTYPSKGHWLKISGDNYKHEVIFDNQNSNSNMAFYVFKSKSGNPDPCSKNKILFTENKYYQNSFSFLLDTEIGMDYYVYLVLISQDASNLTIKNQCLEEIEANSCSNAKNLMCGDTISLYNGSITKNIVIEKTNFKTQKWYKVSKPNHKLKIEFTKPNETALDLVIYEDRCDTLMPIKAIKQFSYFGQIYINLDSSKNYIFSFGAEVPNYLNTLEFKFKITCDKEESELSCKNPAKLTCNTTSAYSTSQSIFINLNSKIEDNKIIITEKEYWVELQGNGLVNELSFSNYSNIIVYEGNCDTLRKVEYNGSKNENNTFISLFTNINKTYLIKFSVPNNYINLVTWGLKCKESKLNDNCIGAQLLECKNDTIFMDLDGISADTLEIPCIINDYPLRWYKVVGSGQLINLYSEVLSYNFFLFEGSCNNLKCISQDNNQMNFIANKNKDYFIAVEAISYNYSNLIVSCQDTALNSVCSFAEEILCSTKVVANFTKSTTKTKSPFGEKFSTLWYMYKGDGNVLKLDGQGNNFYYKIYKSNCNNQLLELSFSNVVNASKLTIETDKDSFYLIQLFASEKIILTLEIDCFNDEKGSSCNDAIGLNCGDTIIYRKKNRLSAIVFQESKIPFSINNAMFIKIDKAGLYKLKAYNTFSYTYARIGFSKYNCDSIFTNLNTTLYNGQSFYANNDGNYYLIFQNDNTDESDTISYYFGVDCLNNESFPNMQCDSAAQLECGTSYVMNNYEGNPTTFNNCTQPEKGSWYQFNGDGNEVAFQFDIPTNNGQSILAYVAEGNCNELKCICSAILYPNNSTFSFETQKDVKYTLKFTSNREFPSIIPFKMVCLPKQNNFACIDALEVQCGDNIKGTMKYEILDLTSLCFDYQHGRYYKIIGNGDIIKLIFNGKNATVHYEIIEDDCKDGRCIYSNLVYANTLSFDSKKNKTYFLKVTNLTSNFLDFKIECEELIENFNCANANTIRCGDSVKCQLTTPLSYSSPQTCSNYNVLQNWFLLPKVNGLYKIKKPTTQSTYNIIVAKGDCTNHQCTYNFSERNEEMIFEISGEVDHYLIVSDPARLTDFIFLELDCISAVANDLCKNAINMECDILYDVNLNRATNNTKINASCINEFEGNDVWYKFTGDGLTRLFEITQNGVNGRISIFNGQDCDTAKCFISQALYEYNPLVIATKVGQEYLIRINANYKYEGGKLNFKFKCYPKVPNDDCEGAIPIITNGTTSINFINLSDDVLNQGCNFSVKNGGWYILPKSDSLYSITLNEDPFNYQIISGTCSNYTCEESGTLFNSQELLIRTNKSKNYYLLLNKTNFTPKQSTVISCRSMSINANDDCKNAEIIACSKNIKFNSSSITAEAPVDFLKCFSFNNRTIFYKFLGDGKVLSLKSENIKIDLNLRIFADCNADCVFNADYYAGGNFGAEFFAIEGKEYILAFAVKSYPLNVDVDIEVSCNEAFYKNVDVKNAELLTCGSKFINTQNVKQNPFNLCSNFQTELYYTFVGNDSFIIIQNLEAIGCNPTIFISDEFCSTYYNFSQVNPAFKTEKGKKYYFKISYGKNEIGTIKFDANYKCIIDGVEFIHDNNVTASPNPFKQNLTLIYNSSNEEKTHISITDIQGKIIFKKDYNSYAGKNEILITDFIPSGVYTISVLSNSINKKLKVIKVE